MSTSYVYAHYNDKSKYDLSDDLGDISQLKSDVSNINDKVRGMIFIANGVKEAVEPHSQAIVHISLSELSDMLGVESFSDFIENWRIVGLEQSFDTSSTNTARWGQGATIEYLDSVGSYFAYPHYTIADNGESTNSKLMLHLFNSTVNAKDISWRITFLHV